MKLNVREAEKITRMLTMPIPDAEVIGRRAAIAEALRRIVPGEGVVEAPIEMRAFETDGLTAYRQMPLVVALPETTEQRRRS